MLHKQRTCAMAEIPRCELDLGALLLRPWRQTDGPALAEAAQASLESVGAWLPWCHANYGLADACAWIDHCSSGWTTGQHYAFGIFERATGNLLGSAGLGQFNPLHRYASLGYWIRQSAQHQGIATHAARAVARFGFQQLGLVRVEIVVLPDNQASRRTAEKAGARFEALARQRLYVGSVPRDAAVYALVPSDLRGT